MIYVVATDQELHLQQLFKLVELTGNEDLRSRISHVSFGLVLGMSTRRGTVVFLDDVLRDVGEKMHEVMRKNDIKYTRVADPERAADILGISSVMVQDMSGKRYDLFTSEYYLKNTLKLASLTALGSTITDSILTQ